MERFLNYQNEWLAADKEVACHNTKVEVSKLCPPVVKLRLLLMIPPISTHFLILHTFSNVVTSSIMPDRCVISDTCVTSYWLNLGELSVSSISCSGKVCDQNEQS